MQYIMSLSDQMLAKVGISYIQIFCMLIEAKFLNIIQMLAKLSSNLPRC